MSEHFFETGETGKQGEFSASVERYPTEEELRQFRWKQQYDHDFVWPQPETIEHFAADPLNPSTDEIAAMNEWNHDMDLEPKITTFEEFFGYPDPRPKDAEVDTDSEPPSDVE